MVWPLRRRAAPPKLSPGTRIFAVGDIHGRLDLLDRVLERIAGEIRSAPARLDMFVFLGDYVDRGPASAGVIERLIHLGQSSATVCLKGNHEAFLLEFLSEPRTLQDWGTWGGFSTLLSYGVAPPLNPTLDDCFELAATLEKAIPAHHLAFLQQLPTRFVQDDYLFVHAGVRPGVPLDQQRDEDLISIRSEFLSHRRPHPKYVVHGHTPVREPEVHPNRLNLDTGAFATSKLSCVVLEDGLKRFI